jgi:tetratricopeptide (TPR) repeat protein
MHASDPSHASADRLQCPSSIDAARGIRRRRLAGGIALVVVTFIAYIPALQSEYVWDDDQYLTDNRLVQIPTGLSAIWALSYDEESGWLRINTSQYYPLVYTSYWIEHLIWGLRPVGYHAVNVALHAISALLVWRLTRRLGIRASWFIAAVFALHPVEVESVAWITERKNVLSGVFYLLALLAGMSFLERGRARWYLASLVLFVAALLSKTVTCSLPVVIVLVCWYRGRRLGSREALLIGPMLLLGLGAGLFTAYVEQTQVGAGYVSWGAGFLERALLVAPRAFCFYAQKVAWPHPLIFIYPRWEPDLAALVSYVPLVVGLGVAALALLGVRRVGWGPALLLAYAGVTLFPALGFVEVYPHRFSWVADHFQYLGSLGFIILYTSVVVWIGRRLGETASVVRVGRVAAVCVLLVLAGLTFRQSRSYENEQRLWSNTLAANPNAWIASLNLGILASNDGRYDKTAEYFEHTAGIPGAKGVAYGNWGIALLRLNRVEGAIAKFEQALEIDPNDARTHASLAAAYSGSGRLEEAERAALTAVRLDPEWSMGWLNLALVYEQQQRWDEAEQCMQRILRLQPGKCHIRVLYAGMLVRMQRWEEAVEYFRSVPPERVRAHGALVAFVEALCQVGEYAEALAACQQGLEAAPDDARLLRKLAWLRATCPVDAIRNGTEAVRITAKLVQLAPDDPVLLDTLACAYAETGDFSAAIATAERALRSARRGQAVELAREIEAHLELFGASRPCRQTHP